MARKLVFSFGIALQVLFVIFVVLSVLQRTSQRSAPKHWPGEFSQPTMSLELSRSPLDVHATFELLGPNGVKAQRRALSFDSLGFIPTYWILFFFMGFILTRVQIPGATLLGVCVVTLITTAAVFDYRENAGIAQILSSYPHDPSSEIVNGTRCASLTKWALTFVTVGTISLLFIGSKNWIAAIGAYLLLVAGIGLFGVLYYYSVIELAFGLTALGLFLSRITFCTEAFLNKL
jgi:hypothetical protein